MTTRRPPRVGTQVRAGRAHARPFFKFPSRARSSGPSLPDVSLFHGGADTHAAANPRVPWRYRIVNSSEMAKRRARYGPPRMSSEKVTGALSFVSRVFSVTLYAPLTAPFTLRRAEGGAGNISRDGSVTRDISCTRSFQISAANNDRGRIGIIMCRRYNGR